MSASASAAPSPASRPAMPTGLETIAQGALTQLHVVHALALRETRTRFGAHHLGYIWALLEPLFWIGTFWGLFTLAGREAPNGMPIVAFLATGVLPYEVAMKTADRCGNAVSGNRALLFYPQVQPIDLVLARGVLEGATYGAIFLVILGTEALVSQRFEIHDPLLVAAGLGLGALFGTALGLVLCALSVLSNVVERLKGPLFRPLFWMSGLFFTAESVPSNVRDVLLYNPILHCVELVRDGFFPSYTAHHVDIGYVLVWIVALAFIGLTLERVVRRKVEVS